MSVEPVHSGAVSRAFVTVVMSLRLLVLPVLVVAAFAAWWWLPGVSSLPDAGVRALLPANTPAERAEQEAARQVLDHLSTSTIQKEGP